MFVFTELRDWRAEIRFSSVVAIVARATSPFDGCGMVPVELSLARCRRRRTAKKAMIARIQPPAATPTPIPALAPVERPAFGEVRL